MVGCPQLRTSTDRSRVEDALRAEILVQVRRLPEIHRLMGRPMFACLLRCVTGSNKHSVEDSGYDSVANQRRGRARAHPIFATSRMISSPQHPARGDLWLIDGRYRLRLVGQTSSTRSSPSPTRSSSSNDSSAKAGPATAGTTDHHDDHDLSARPLIATVFGCASARQVCRDCSRRDMVGSFGTIFLRPFHQLSMGLFPG